LLGSAEQFLSNFVHYNIINAPNYPTLASQNQWEKNGTRI